MKKAFTLLLISAMFQGGCAQTDPPDLERLDQVILLDVQGLWGGQDLWISRDGKAICRIVTSEDGGAGLQETRFEFFLSEKQRVFLLELIHKHSFFSIRTKDRYGVPDEARPSLFVKSGPTSYAVGKWSNVNNKDFDPLYEFLLTIVKSGKEGKQIHHGPLDWNWKPDGFPENKSIWDITRPKVKIN